VINYSTKDRGMCSVCPPILLYSMEGLVE